MKMKWLKTHEIVNCLRVKKSIILRLQHNLTNLRELYIGSHILRNFAELLRIPHSDQL